MWQVEKQQVAHTILSPYAMHLSMYNCINIHILGGTGTTTDLAKHTPGTTTFLAAARGVSSCVIGILISVIQQDIYVGNNAADYV